MSAIVAAGLDGTTVSSTTFDGVSVAHRFRARRVEFGTTWERILHAIGRAVMRMPPSSWMLMDITLLSVSIYVAYGLFPPSTELITPHIALWQALPVFSFAIITASLVFGLYERSTIMSRSRIMTRIGLTVAMAALVAYAIIYVIMYMIVGRRFSVLALSLFVVGGGMIRLAAWWFAHQVRCGLILVGSRELYDSFVKVKEEGMLHEYALTGYAGWNGEQLTSASDDAYLGPIETQIDRLGQMGVTDIVVDESATRNPDVMNWVVPCLQHGCRVTNEAIFYETATGQILVDQITPAWFLFADLKVHCDEHATLKRLMDMTLSVIGLMLTIPIWPLIALAIKMGDGGSVFYSQDRIGQHGKRFKLYKFRTMRMDAENGKSIWSSPNDPRVTRMGRLLRKSRLDELPQLYNVLRGQMSLVGPRPERPDIVENLCQQVPYYAERHLVKPGVTGWAQISFRYGNSVEDSKRKLQFDLYYLKHISFELDMIILFRTAGTFLKGGC